MKPRGSIMGQLGEKLGAATSTSVPQVTSFMEFLTTHARVKTTGGEYVPYSLEGREAMIPIIETFDLVLGSHTGKPLPDATIDICGGAQIGKTVLSLNFGAYVTAVLYYNWGYYLPDDDLVEGIVDTKLRPDVIEQIEWLGPLMQVGKTEDKRGKSVNRKGAFQVSDGKRKAFGMIRGMGKIPTTFSMDVAMEDEKDDIPAKRSKYLTGRMTASPLRLRCSIGTQRYHGAGQQKQWEDGSQGIFLFDVGNGRQINLEEQWPSVCRLAVDGTPKPTDPKLTNAGDFRDDQGNAWAYEPGAPYYFADPDTGAVVDRFKPILKHLRPDRLKLLKFSFRLSQLCLGAMPVNQFVSRWQDAVRDPEMMTVFRCDVLAMPANSEQAISPEILLRARTVEEGFDLRLTTGTAPRYGGLDTGNRCWFISREIFSEARKHINWAEQIPLSQMVARTETLFHKLGLTTLAIDANPAVDQARSLCYRLNGLEGIDWQPFNGKTDEAVLKFPGGLTWNGKLKRWEGLRCFVVEFSVKQGGGIIHELGKDPQGGFNRFYPKIRANRFDSIDRIINEFLTPEENVIRVVDGKLLEEPVMRLPQKQAGSPPIVETLDAHLVTGSKRGKGSNDEPTDYVDGCENHLT
ncbi:MAG: hypothetical protein EOP88_17095, partial [Verrucomicrobiaceae bacterium]